MRTKYTAVNWLLFFFSCFLVSCASFSHEDMPLTPQVSVGLMDTQTLISRYGASYEINPYLPSRGLLTGQTNEFIVLEIRTESPVPGTLSISAKAETPEGITVATLRDWRWMQDYWAFVRGIDDVKIAKRQSNLDRSYMRSNPLDLSAGRNKFYVVLVGKNPMPRPASISVVVKAFGANPEEFKFVLPPVLKTGEPIL